MKITKCRRNLIKIFCISLVCALSFLRGVGVCSAQNIGINGTGSTPNISAGLDVDFTNKGLLIPRVTLTQTTSNSPIGASVATSLLVYNTATINDVTPGYYYWGGAAWVRFNTGTSASNDWALLGNAATNPSTNFIGTTDAQDFVIRTNNAEKVRVLSSNGNVGIGTSAPSAKLHVLNGNIQTVQDQNFAINGTWSYSNVLNESGHFIGYKAGGTLAAPTHPLASSVLAAFHGRNAIFPSNAIGGMVVTTSENHSASALGTKLSFITTLNGTTTPLVKAVITDNGNFGIGTLFPTAKLEIQGSIKIVDGTQGAGKVLTTDATGLASWQTPASGGNSWDLIGNTGTNPATNFIGTTDAQDLVIKAANTSHIRIKGYGITKIRIGELTNSPIATGDPMLDLYSSSGTVIRLRSFTSINKPIFYFQRGRGSATSPSPTLSGDNLGELNWMGTGAATTDGFTSAMIRSISSQNWSGSTTRGSDLEFYTVNTVGASIATDNIANQRMIILPDGPIGINTAGTANARLDIRGGGNTSGTFALGVRNSTDTWMFAVRDDGLVGVNTIAPTANLSVNGSANKSGGGSWAVFSDKRLKNNITDYKEGIELLKQIHTVKYQYNEKYLEEFGFNEDIKSGKTYYGVIAQELQKVSPDMVKEVTLPNGHTYLEADLSKLNITLINTVVNQQTEIDELKRALKELLLKLD